MSTDKARNTWDKLAARAKQQWGKLTDDEVTQAEGNIDELIARINEKYGDSKQAIAARFNEFKEDIESDDD